MPSEDLVPFSDLADSHPLALNGDDTLIAVAQPDTSTETGYVSQTTTPNQLGAHIIQSQTHAGLKTSSKIVENAINSLVDDFTNINIIGSTNDTGSTITVGTYFYLNGALCRAINAIGTGVTLTLNINYVTITAGSLNEFAPQAGTLTNMHSAFTGGNYSLTRSGRICVLSFFRGITGSIVGNEELATLPSGFIPYADTRLSMNSTYNGTGGAFSVEVTTGGKVVATVGSGNLTSAMTISGTYICS